MTNELEEKMRCILAGVGEEIGSLIACMVQAEIAANVTKIQALQAIFTCQPSTGNPADDVSPPT